MADGQGFNHERRVAAGGCWRAGAGSAGAFGRRAVRGGGEPTSGMGGVMAKVRKLKPYRGKRRRIKYAEKNVVLILLLVLIGFFAFIWLFASA